ncbi:MAG: hypothetical protein GOVbin1573_76 [Prokaryotic dsDNA virus sp.]|nr:MAG: hypothetical protein GOVbin1573_76 [Prokaryotic dsDNA virus sp.]|tara:strand:- start:1204 stop:1452 length:249 start_codon:yes stop_codon:yes gene_type:complete
MGSMTPHDLITALGVHDVSAATGAELSTVRKQRYREKMPAGWWVACLRLCEEKGLPTPPPILFGMAVGPAPAEHEEAMRGRG